MSRKAEASLRRNIILAIIEERSGVPFRLTFFRPCSIQTIVLSRSLVSKWLYLAIRHVPSFEVKGKNQLSRYLFRR